MKKILLIGLLLFTGCEVKYNLEFYDDNIKEEVKIILPKKEKNKVSELKERPAYAIYSSVGGYPYATRFENKLTNFEATYTYTYGLDVFPQARSINECFDAVAFTKREIGYTLSTSTGFKCMFYDYLEVDNVKVTIQTNRKVIDNNADSKKGNKYIWYINDDNAESTNINITFSNEKNRSILTFVYDNLTPIILIAGVGLIITGSIVTVVLINRKNNEI